MSIEKNPMLDEQPKNEKLAGTEEIKKSEEVKKSDDVNSKEVKKSEKISEEVKISEKISEEVKKSEETKKDSKKTEKKSEETKKDSKKLVSIKNPQPFQKAWARFPDHPFWPALICRKSETNSLKSHYNDTGVGILCFDDTLEYSLIDKEDLFDYERYYDRFSTDKSVKKGVELLDKFDKETFQFPPIEFSDNESGEDEEGEDDEKESGDVKTSEKPKDEENPQEKKSKDEERPDDVKTSEKPKDEEKLQERKPKDEEKSDDVKKSKEKKPKDEEKPQEKKSKDEEKPQEKKPKDEEKHENDDSVKRVKHSDQKNQEAVSVQSDDKKSEDSQSAGAESSDLLIEKEIVKTFKDESLNTNSKYEQYFTDDDKLYPGFDIPDICKKLDYIHNNYPKETVDISIFDILEHNKDLIKNKNISKRLLMLKMRKYSKNCDDPLKLGEKLMLFGDKK
ncbi:hypothetical protein M153_5670001766 [Pseudoloma neurophilia]|uniref:PWWP domain-containing protein n=1 Tax=Pseudoloma neurophilia TaxID=146866 RepID=A0A0R0LWT0_9MICR|nr:hypothetical protein M153_5670001766 [Pseudoloma neurophilia]